MKKKLVNTTFITLTLLLSLKIEAQINIIQPKDYIEAKDIFKQVGAKLDLLNEEDSNQFILLLDNAIVINEGGIVTNNGKILIDTQTSNKDQHRLLKKGRDISLENPMYFKGKLVVISSPGQENWYHFLLQVLPRLKILKESGVEYDKIFINNVRFKFQRDTLNHILDILDIPKDEILEINSDVIIQAEKLIVPSVPFIPSKGKILPKWMKRFLRTSFLDNIESKINKNLLQADKIYISRAKAGVRRISNEEELTDYLKKINFQIIYLEDLTSFDQAYLFNNAKIIIGPHGSGFANLIFSEPKTKIIEIDHDADEVRSFYKKFSFIMDCLYYPFYTDKVSEENLEDDIYIDMPKFIKHLNNIL